MSSRKQAAAKTRPRRVQTRFKIRDLPPQARQELDQKLREKKFGGYRKVSRWLLETHGADISPSGLNYYHRQNFELHLDSVTEATALVDDLFELTGGDQTKIALLTATVAQALTLDMVMARRELEEARKASRRAHQRGDLLLRNKARKKAAEAPEEATGSEPADAEDVPVRQYPVKADFELMKAAISAMAAIKVFRDMVTAQLRGEGQAASEEPLSEGGGLSPQAEASIRAALMDVPVSPVSDNVSSEEVK